MSKGGEREILNQDFICSSTKIAQAAFQGQKLSSKIRSQQRQHMAGADRKAAGVWIEVLMEFVCKFTEVEKQISIQGKHFERVRRELMSL